jgi:hypothetical protein
VGDELVESVEGDERCDFAHTHEDGAGSRFFAGNVTAVGFCIAPSSARQILLNSRKESWRYVARD